jgi:hypothetical protein
MRFIGDVTIPDDTALSPGAGFVKTWRIQNSGTCAWEAGAGWIFADGHQMNGPHAVGVPATAPGETADLSVSLIAPAQPGRYTGYWALRAPAGQVIDKRYYVRIVVATPTATATATPTRPPATATPVIVNWRGEYFNNVGLVGNPALVRDDTAVGFNWGTGSPAPAVAADNFSARWTRSVYLDGDTYRFYASADDGVRIWVDDLLLIDQWHNAVGVTYQAERALGAGNHTLRVEYYENGGAAGIQFWWSRAESYPEWRGEYWSNRNLSGASTLVRNDTAVSFDWGSQAPAASLPADNFSARWTRSLSFNEGTYRFFVHVDDGLRLYVDNVLILDEWRDGAARQRSVDHWLGGGLHTIRVDYYEHGGEAGVRLWWEPKGGYPDWRGEYWSNRSLRGDPALIRNDQEIRFNWEMESPASGLPQDGFSARWRRRLTFSPGSYQFNAKADDGIRVYVDGRRVLDKWYDSAGTETHRVTVPLQGEHTITVEYYENRFSAKVRFWYERIGGLPTATSRPTQTPLPTGTPRPSATPVPTPVPTLPTSTPAPTDTPQPSPTPTVTATASASPSLTPTATATAGAIPAPGGR